MIRRIPLLLAGLLASGCALGPAYRPAPVPPAAEAAFITPAPVRADTAPDQWWRLYDDPVLDALVEQAFAANTDLRAATANLARVRAVLLEARGGRLPTTSITGSAVEARQAVPTPQGPVAFESAFYRLGLDASYEIDLYGRVGSAIAAARAEAEAEAAARDTVRITVAAETARAYADACSAARQLKVAEQSLKLQSDSFGLTERRVAAGRDAPIDLARARAQQESTRATLPAFTAARQSALARLAFLTGRPPAEVDPRAAACAAPPQLAQEIPVGDGAALLRRRPDIRQAERLLAADTARISVAIADLFPQISLGGSISGQGVTPGAALSNRGFAFSLGPAISWSFPNVAVARARIRQSRASADASLARFDGSVLGALRETETALADYASSLNQRAALTAARDQSAEAARLVRLRYGAGAEAFLAVLDAERTLATAEAQLAATEAQLTTTQIAVFKALGGGWAVTEEE
ncbi:efflux transporter outer membrane subunit [Polymorphobacter sp.]|uniref:efflux transporter outer membrane subunit n=1 Tax=Polymorphobacter sp. TaxID=1909290 RepID=UPI003F70CE07